MFVRKGTTLRKKHQSVRRPRRPSLPSQHATSPDPEAACDISPSPSSRGSVTSHGAHTHSTVAPTRSNASSTLTLSDEKSLVHHHSSGSTGTLRGSRDAILGGGSSNYGTTTGGATLGSSYRHLQLYHLQHQSAHVNYGSFLYQVKEALEEASGLLDFLQRIGELIWQTMSLTILLFSLFALPISMLAMGTSYLEDCPKEPKIPIYLLVGGAFGLVHICIVLWQQKRSRDYMQLDDAAENDYLNSAGGGDDDDDDDDVMRRSSRFTGYVLTLFLLLWFSLGNVWVLRIWEPNYAQPLHEPRNWCSKQLYLYAVYQLVACYTLLGILVTTFIAFLLTWCCCRGGVSGGGGG